jgi:Rps23 Pro-64 3,4-dihydroxylase Tpa1-like proline 4-hydroxylase
MLSRWAVPPAIAERTLRWMETSAPWSLRVASFYEQWEMHLDQEALPVELQELLSPTTVARLVHELLSGGVARYELIEVTAHRMVVGQTIRIHNDFRPGGETDRVLIQLNRGWADHQGGLLMLFASGDADDVCRVIRPLHGSGFGFRISEASFHAVSTVTEGERFTLVYSFREMAD